MDVEESSKTSINEFLITEPNNNKKSLSKDGSSLKVLTFTDKITIQDTHTKKQKSINRFTWSLIIIWTVLIIGFFVIDTQELKNITLELATNEARANFKKDQAFRLWVASHGGLYVSINNRTQPNPYLSHIPEQNIQTPEGKNLTLMNPAYVLRQFNEEYSEFVGVIGHITSLNPLRPENAPDEWEKAALLEFEKGVLEVSEVATLNGEQYIRLMQPLITQEACLKCHGFQGYQVDDVRGGVSVSVPLSSYLAKENQNFVIHIRNYGVIWVIGLFGIILTSRKIKHDIDEIAKTKRLEEQNQQLQRVAEMKNRFISMATHELRTPLTSIKGYTDLILSGRVGKISKRISKLLNVIERNTDRLSNLTSELLDQQRLESGRLEISSEPVQLQEVVEEVVLEFQLFISDKSQVLNVQVPTDLSLMNADRTRIGQVLLNLLSNASKFTPKNGSINLQVKEAGEMIEVQVSDTGIGIAKEDLLKLFKPFPDIQRPVITEASVGLGLSICKGIIDLHGRKIWAESEGEGMGTTFTIPK